MRDENLNCLSGVEQRERQLDPPYRDSDDPQNKGGGNDPAFYRPSHLPLPTTYPDDLPCVEKAVRECEEAQGLPNMGEAAEKWYVPELARPQYERVESFVKLLREISCRFKLGHMVLVYEGEFEGRAGVYQLANLELHSDAEEWLMMLLAATANINKRPPTGDAKIGFEDWERRERERLAAREEAELVRAALDTEEGRSQQWMAGSYSNINAKEHCLAGGVPTIAATDHNAEMGLPWRVDYDGPSRPIILTSHAPPRMFSFDEICGGTRCGSFDGESQWCERIVAAVNTRLEEKESK